MNLSAPTMPVFLISVILAILVAVVKYAGVSIPVVGQHMFEALGIAYILLFLGVVLKNV